MLHLCERDMKLGLCHCGQHKEHVLIMGRPHFCHRLILGQFSTYRHHWDVPFMLIALVQIIGQMFELNSMLGILS